LSPIHVGADRLNGAGITYVKEATVVRHGLAASDTSGDKSRFIGLIDIAIAVCGMKTVWLASYGFVD
jgi:hypothetical protein